MLKARGSFAQLLFLSLAATVLTFFTGVFGAPFLRVIHKRSRPVFWLAGLLVAVLFGFLQAGAFALVIVGVWMTIGLYSEFEDLGWGWKRSALISLFVSGFLGIAGFRHLLNAAGVVTWDGFVSMVREKLDLLSTINPTLKLDAELFAQQAPSFWLMLLVLCLGTALILEGRLFTWLGLPRERVASHLRLLEFRLPDWMIWIALTGLLVTMVDFGSKPLAILGGNVVNVLFVLYFFQGLAILEVLLNAMRAGAFMRAAIYVILVGQLFFMLSAVGLIDYWLDFRRRLRKTGAPTGDETKFGGSV